MIGKFLVRIAFVRAQHACHACVAAFTAIGMSFNAMCQARENIPSRVKRHRGSRACADAGAGTACRTRIEADGGPRTIKLVVEQQRGAKCDPWSEPGVDDHPDNTWPRKSRQHCQLHEIQCRASVTERIYDRATDSSGADPRSNLLLDHLAGEIVERIIASEPARVFG